MLDLPRLERGGTLEALGKRAFWEVRNVLLHNEVELLLLHEEEDEDEEDDEAAPAEDGQEENVSLSLGRNSSLLLDGDDPGGVRGTSSTTISGRGKLS